MAFCLPYIFWHSICHSFWHAFRHSIWHSIWYIFWHSIWNIFWHSIWHSIGHTFWHTISTFYLTYILASYLAYMLAFYLAFYLSFHLAVEVQRCSLGSGAGEEDWRDTWRGGEGEEGGGAALIKSSNPHLAGGELIGVWITRKTFMNSGSFFCICLLGEWIFFTKNAPSWKTSTAKTTRCLVWQRLKVFGMNCQDQIQWKIMTFRS